MNWTSLSSTYLAYITCCHENLHLFPLPKLRIRSIIQRYPPSTSFEKLHSAVYLIWSPFTEDFYIGSFDRLQDTCAYRRLTEHLKLAYDPRPLSGHVYFHHVLARLPGAWCISIVKANPDNAVIFEKYVIKNLHPTLNKQHVCKHKPKYRDQPLRLRFTTCTPTKLDHNTTTTHNRFVYKPCMLSHHPTTEPATEHSFTSTNLAPLHLKTFNSPNLTLFFIPGFQHFLPTMALRNLHHTFVTLRNPFGTIVYRGLFRHFLNFQSSLPDHLFHLSFNHLPTSRKPANLLSLLLSICRSNTLKPLRYLTTSSYLYLYKNATLLPARLQTFLRFRLASAFRKYNNTKLNPSLSFSLPYHPQLPPLTFRRTIANLYHLHEFDSTINTHLRDSTTFSTRKHQSISDFFINYKHYSSTWSPTQLPPCTCEKYKKFFPPSTTQHLGAKAIDLLIPDSSLFQYSSSTIPFPSNQNLRQDILDAFERLTTTFNPFADTISHFYFPSTLPPYFPLHVFNLSKHNVLFYHTRTGKKALTMHKERFKTLLSRYLANQQNRTDFLAHLASTVSDYSDILSEQHWRTPPSFLSMFATHLLLTIECFASPLDWSYEIFLHYFSRFQSDTKFGSFGDVFLHLSSLFGWVNPEYTPQQLLQAFLWCLYNVTSTTQPRRFLLFVPLRKKGESFEPLLHLPFIHKLFTFPPHTFSFDSPSYSLGSRATSNAAPLSLGLFLIQNNTAYTSYPLPTTLQSEFSHWCEKHCATLPSTTLCYPKKPPPISYPPLSDLFTLLKHNPTKTTQTQSFPDKNKTNLNFKRVIKTTTQNTTLCTAGLHLLPSFWNSLNTITNATQPTNSITTDTVKPIANTFKHLCWSPLDRNPGCLFACCPQQYHTALKTLFYDDPHYEHSTLTQEHILQRWKTYHHTHNIKQYFPYKQSTDLPYAYALIKNKDTKKSRPIVSYFNHPLRSLFNLTSRCLMFLLNACTHLKHFTLPTTQHFIPMFYNNLLKTTRETIHDEHALLDFMSHSFDVKNMYTELPHTSIVNAIRWLLGEAQSTRYGRHRRVHCSRNGRLGVSFASSGGHVSLSFNQLLQFVLFDLENVFFTLGAILLKQINGIPMGSPTSPALAIIVCAHAEHTFLKSILDFPRFFAVRYMDDIHVTTVTATSDTRERQRAQRCFDELASIYPSSLTLEHTGSLSTDFLESLISYPTLPCSLTDLENPLSDSDHSFTTRYLIKNKSSLASPILKFSRLQHSTSYRRSSQMRGALIGTFLRLPRHSSSTSGAFLSALQLLCELHHLEYSPKTLMLTISKIARTHPDPLWPHLRTLLQTPSYINFISNLKLVI